jgi:uncharacterized protein (TIGR00251 family)
MYNVGEIWEISPGDFTKGGMILSIRVKPNSRENKVSKENGVITVRIHAPAQDGKANKAVLEFLARAMGIPKAYIELAGGMTSANKRIAIGDEYKSKVEEFVNAL